MKGNNRPIFFLMVRSLPPQPDHPLASLLGSEGFSEPAFSAALRAYLLLTGENREFVVGEVEREAAKYQEHLLNALKWADEVLHHVHSDNELLARAKATDPFRGIMAHGGLNVGQAFKELTGQYVWIAARSKSETGALFPKEQPEAADE